MTTIAYNFRIGVLTARQIILDVSTAIWDALASIYLPVPSEIEWHSIAGEFFPRWNFPNCIGAIDGKHTMIQCPVNCGSLFYNYKSYFSIFLLAVASADYRFVMVDIGAYGSSNDSGILNNTALFKCLKKKKLGIPPSKQLPNYTKETCVPHILLGDDNSHSSTSSRLFIFSIMYSACFRIAFTSSNFLFACFTVIEPFPLHCDLM